MKKFNLHLMALAALLILSCGGAQEPSTSNDTIISENTNSETSDFPTEQKKSTIIGSLEIAPEDHSEQMAWFPSLQEASKMGDGWRLPTREEFKILYANKDLIGGFDTEYGTYWTSTGNEDEPTQAWVFNFKDGKYYAQSKSAYKYSFRVVRDI